MEISVIVPARNAERTLAQTLRSLQSQTHKSWEAIIVDDGSVDGTAKVAAEFTLRDARFRFISQLPTGESGARNAGIALAHFDWLLFLDADDWVLPRHIECLSEAALKNPKLDAVHCGWVRVATDGRLSEPRYGPDSEDLFEYLVQYNPFAIHACLVRRSHVESVGRFDTSLTTCPDWDLWLKIARTGARFGRVFEVLACYRMTPHAAGLNALQVLVDGLTVIDRGHTFDPRCPTACSAHLKGAPKSGLPAARLAHMCWSAGLMLGSGADAGLLLQYVADSTPDLDPEPIAYRIFESCGLPQGRVLSEWPVFWPSIRDSVHHFLMALESRALPGLGERAFHFLEGLVKKRLPLEADRPNDTSVLAMAGHSVVETPKEIEFGDLRRVEPLSRHWGYDRGVPIDRYYIENFLARHSSDIRGRVLEVADESYTKKFGGSQVTSNDILDVSPQNQRATIIADLPCAEHISSETFDCVILTQTLDLIYDVKGAIKTVHRILKPNGVVLATLPGITRISWTESPGCWFWSFTTPSTRALFSECFPAENVEVCAYGNVLAATAFLYGLAVHELRLEELDFRDRDYELLLTVRARKAASHDS